MSDTITLVLHSAVLPGQANQLKKVLEEIVDHCQKTEPGMLAYNWYLSADESECKVIEIYTDSEALLFHLSNYAPFRSALGECRRIEDAVLLGDPSDELKDKVAALQPKLYGNFFSYNK